MTEHPRPKFQVLIFGDWHTVIGVREYRDALIDQKPDDEDSANYDRYQVPCDSAAAMVEAFNKFTAAGLHAEFAVKLEAKAAGLSAYASTGSGWSKKGELYSEIEVDQRQCNKLVHAAIADAIESLESVK